MGLSETYINILNHPTVDATINFIKKFKSSKSYWSVSYLILLFTIREAVAWKFGSAIKTFCEIPAVESSFSTFLEVLGFILDVGGSWELVALGTFVFVVLSLVKVAESEGTSISVRENYLTLFLLVFVGSVSFYQNDEVKSIVEENSKVLKKIEQDKNVTNYLIEDIKKKDLKYAKLEAEYESLRKSIREKAPNAEEIIDNANKILKEKGIESAIYYCKIELSFLEKKEKMSLVEKEESTSTIEDSVENIDESQEQVEVIETNKTLDAIMTFIDNTVEIDRLIYENIPFTKRYTWYEAKEYCNSKENTWRLPFKDELKKNIVYTKIEGGSNSNRLIDEGIRMDIFTVDNKFLENIKDAKLFWSATVKDDNLAWVVGFNIKVPILERLDYKEERNYHVLCVQDKDE